MILFDKIVLEKIAGHLIKNKENAGLAESVSAGLLQLAFSQMNKCMNFFEGGITAYNLIQKSKHLQINVEEAEKVNSVSVATAEEMACGATRLFNTNWGLALTGYASPAPESGGKIFACYAICHNLKITESGIINPPEKDTPSVQLYYSNELLKIFHSILDRK